MKTKILFNPEKGKDIIDYRIEEAEFDHNGNMVMDANTGRVKWTGNTLEWSIRVGEKVEFPEYVADYLKKTYSFLQVISKEEVKEKKEEVLEVKGKKAGGFTCRFCGRDFSGKVQLGVHIGTKHTDKIT